MDFLNQLWRVQWIAVGASYLWGREHHGVDCWCGSGIRVLTWHAAPYGVRGSSALAATGSGPDRFARNRPSKRLGRVRKGRRASTATARSLSHASSERAWTAAEATLTRWSKLCSRPDIPALGSQNADVQEDARGNPHRAWGARFDPP